MISTIVASLPSDGPPWMRAIRPTSTSLHDDALISASPIVIYSDGEQLAESFGDCDRVWRTYWAICRGFVVVMKLRWAAISHSWAGKSLGFAKFEVNPQALVH
jgi:hypothetical protein